MSKENNNIDRIIEEITNKLKNSKFDPNGSYTGVTKSGEQPIQDQDDL